MRLAFTRWGLSPAAFWAMTPRELAACLPAPARDRPDSAALAALMRRFPDHLTGAEDVRPARSL